MTEPQLRAIRISEVIALEEAGYQLMDEGDASKANGDFFMVFIRRADDDVQILCPSFLRGSLGINGGRFSY